jgi:hypothetical protein
MISLEIFSKVFRSLVTTETPIKDPVIQFFANFKEQLCYRFWFLFNFKEGCSLVINHLFVKLIALVTRILLFILVIIYDAHKIMGKAKI